MPSYYDEKAKCRVGVMDEEQFYAESSKDSGLFFKALIEDDNVRVRKPHRRRACAIIARKQRRRGKRAERR